MGNKPVNGHSRRSPHYRNPELYNGPVWLERDLFNMVHLFAHWNPLTSI